MGGSRAERHLEKKRMTLRDFCRSKACRQLHLAFVSGICWSVLAVGGFAQDSEVSEPVYSPGIVWKRPSPDADREFARKLQELVLSDELTPSLIHEKTLLVVDPRMWTWLRREPGHAELDLVETRVGLPRVSGDLQCESRCFRGREAALWVVPHLRSRYSGDAGEEAVLRHPTSEEMDYVWALIPFDIEGPVLTLESSERRIVAMSTLDESMVHLYEMPKQPMGLEAALDSLAALPLTGKEASPMASRIEDPDLDLPGLIAEDDILAIMLTDGDRLSARVSGVDLKAYLQSIDDTITAAVPEDAGRVLVQVSLDAATSPTVHLRAPALAQAGLKDALLALKPPVCRGPITFIAVKDR